MAMIGEGMMLIYQALKFQIKEEAELKKVQDTIQ